MSGPDVRWEGISHRQIVFWVACGRGSRVTEVLEDRLTKAAEALTRTADLANATLQRVNAGEWTGNAATLAAQAMQVARDFDDAMGHHGKTGTLAAFGQSGIADWAKSTVPPVASVEAPAPTGSLMDMVNATKDYNNQAQAARDAAEQARRVMRDYESMTVDRIAAMPPLSPPPQIVAADAPDTIIVPPGGPGPGTGSRHDFVLPRGDDTIDGAVTPRPGGTPAADLPDKALPDSDLPGSDLPGSDLPGRDPTGPAATGPAAVTDSRPVVTSPVGSGVGSDTLRPGGLTSFVGGPGPLGGADGQRGNTGGPRPVVPGIPGGRVGMTEARGSAHGMAPVGRGGSDEDKEHQVKYGIAGSEIFEPDHVDGLLHDPFRPGSFVAPATIGDDEDE